jgi:hypothetical protein
VLAGLARYFDALTRTSEVLGFIENFVGAGKQGGRDKDTGSSACYPSPRPRYRIKFAHTAKYKSKPHATAIHTNQIAILPNLGTFP